MEIKRKTEIFIETNRQFVVRGANSDARIFCPDCQKLMLSAEQSAAYFSVSRRVVYQLMERQSIHFSETESGVIFVCSESLAAVLTKN